MGQSSAFDKLVRECSRWGVRVMRVPKPRRMPKDYSSAPFSSTLGISVNRKAIYLSGDFEKSNVEVVGGILHELAHIAMNCQPEEITNEIECGMLALEYYTAKRIGVFKEWNESMRDYSIGDDDWGTASKADKRKAVADSAKEARGRGLLAGTKPTYKRPKKWPKTPPVDSL